MADNPTGAGGEPSVSSNGSDEWAPGPVPNNLAAEEPPEPVAPKAVQQAGGPDMIQAPRFNLNSVNNVNATWIDVSYDVMVANQLVTNMSGLVGHEYRRYYFTHSAHWLAAWLAGWLGAAIAAQLASRRLAVGRASEQRPSNSPL